MRVKFLDVVLEKVGEDRFVHIAWRMKMYHVESRRKGILYVRWKEGRLNGLATSFVGSVFSYYWREVRKKEELTGKWGRRCKQLPNDLNPLAPNDVYISRTAQLTSRRCISNIYSTNILNEYFKHAAHSPFFFLQDAVYFIMLPFLVPVIFTF